MARPRTPIGTFGDIDFFTTHSGVVGARVRYRDDDGRLRRVQATGPTRKVAEHRLKEKLSRRGTHVSGLGDLAPDTPFTRLVDVWLEDLDLEGKIAPSTRDLYERNMRQWVLPAFEHYTLREITVANVDRFLKAKAKTSYSMAKQAKTARHHSAGGRAGGGGSAGAERRDRSALAVVRRHGARAECRTRVVLARPQAPVRPTFRPSLPPAPRSDVHPTRGRTPWSRCVRRSATGRRRSAGKTP